MINKNDNYKELKIDAIAEQWVSLVLAHARAKKLTETNSVKTNKKALKQMIHQNK